MYLFDDINGKNVLFLQGPNGLFFKKVDKLFRRNGAKTYKICLNAGDFLFSNKDNVTNYKDTKHNWCEFIEKFIRKNRIDWILLFGDCRFYHKQAITVASEMGVQVYVFEEGYIRPNYVTVEKNGVNANSSVPRDNVFYANLTNEKEADENHCNVNHAYQKMATQSTIYYAVTRLFRRQFPHYEHHREASPVKELYFGILNGIRKITYKIKERGFVERLRGELSKKYYFVPLQTHNDFQCTVHSGFSNIEGFLRQVIKSFALNAPADTYLIIKHHPMDRGINNYCSFITNISKSYGLKKRIIYVHDVHLPTCLKNALGTVTINSTVGLSSLYHGISTITLGKAMYDIDGITCKGMDLNRFWIDHTPPDRKLFLKFRNYVIQKTQLSGSFYTGFPRELMPNDMAKI